MLLGNSWVQWGSVGLVRWDIELIRFLIDQPCAAVSKKLSHPFDL